MFKLFFLFAMIVVVVFFAIVIIWKLKADNEEESTFIIDDLDTPETMEIKVLKLYNAGNYIDALTIVTKLESENPDSAFALGIKSKILKALEEE